MAKDFLNLIERALMMGISDKINHQTAAGNDIYVYGQYPESEELKFPAVIVQQVASGHEEKFDKTTYISKVGIYDENDNLIMIASLANPKRKKENEEFTIKLTYDI